MEYKVRKSFIKSLQGIQLTKVEQLIENIQYSNLGVFTKHFIRFIKRLPKWIKVAWNQEDWDYEYLYDLIELKLKEFLQAQEQDTWHVERETKLRAKQIRVCLARLDRYRNWTEYYDYPMDDIKHVEIQDPKYGTCYRLEHTNPENEKQRQGAHYFEQHNYDKFWKDFMKWHTGWWT